MTPGFVKLLVWNSSCT